MPLTENHETEKSGLPPSKPLRKRLISGAFWSVIGRVGSIGALFLSHVLLARELSEADYAAYLTVSATTILLATLICFGTPKMLIRALKHELKHGNLAGARAAVRSCFSIITMIAGFAGIGMFVFVVGLIYCGGESSNWRGLADYSCLVAAWAFLSAFCLVASHALQAMDDFRSAMLVGARNGGVIANVLFFLVALCAHWFGFLSLGLAIGLQVIVHLLALAVGVVCLRRKFRQIEKSRAPSSDFPPESSSHLSDHSTRWFLRESWPNFVVQITSMSLIELQIILVVFFATERDIADYGAALRILSVINAVHALSTTVIAPFIAELFDQKRLPQLERVLRGSATLVAIPTLAAMIVFVLFPKEILTMTFGSDFAGGAWALRILSLGSTVAILSGSNGLTMIMAGKQHILMIYSVAVSLFYLVVAVPAVHSWGIIGAATSVGLVFGAYNIWITFLVKKEVGVWTVPTFSPRDILATIGTFLGSEKRECANS